MIRLTQIINFDSMTVRRIEEFIHKHHSNPEGLWTLEDEFPRPKLHQFDIRNEDGVLVGITSVQKVSNYLGVVQKHIIDGDFRGKGYGVEALEKLETLFRGRDVKKLAAYILENNLASLSTFQKAGYKIEGYLRDHFGEGLGCYVLGRILK